MKFIGLLIFGIAFSFFAANAQEDELLKDLPKTKEDFIASEKKLLATIDWLEKTPLNEQADKRKELNALVVAWIINSPTVSLEINSKTTPSTKKNPEMILFFMAGWARYAIQNSYSKDVVQGTLAGIRSVLNVYKNNSGVKKDKEIDKLVTLEEKNELEEWVKKQLAAK